jgi:hypothetical protein
MLTIHTYVKIDKHIRSKSLWWRYSNRIIHFLDIIHLRTVWRQGLALSIGPNRTGFLPEDRDKALSLKCLKKLRWVMSRKLVIHCTKYVRYFASHWWEWHRQDFGHFVTTNLCWRFPVLTVVTGMQCHMVQQQFISVSQEHAASISRAEE